MYTFKNSHLNSIWRIHPSYKKSVIFQRLEFFGDKILSFVLTSYLLKNEKLNEGELSIQLSTLINKYTMAKVGEFLVPYIIKTGTLTTAMICDCVEVYIACVYLDGGDVFTLIHDMWSKFLYQNYSASYKNQLQELVQSYKLNIDYEYEKINGYFICYAKLKENEEYCSKGQGKSKKEASANAAKMFLQKWSKEIKKLI